MPRSKYASRPFSPRRKQKPPQTPQILLNAAQSRPLDIIRPMNPIQRRNVLCARPTRQLVQQPPSVSKPPAVPRQPLSPKQPPAVKSARSPKPMPPHRGRQLVTPTQRSVALPRLDLRLLLLRSQARRETLSTFNLPRSNHRANRSINGSQLH